MHTQKCEQNDATNALIFVYLGYTLAPHWYMRQICISDTYATTYAPTHMYAFVSSRRFSMLVLLEQQYNCDRTLDLYSRNGKICLCVAYAQS